MNNEQKQECEYIRSLSSQEAADWLMEKYSLLPYSLSHRSWKKVDQFRLAHYYLRDSLPFVSHHGYEAFLHVMSVKNFIKVLREFLIDIDSSKLDLFLYYLTPMLVKYSKNEDDKKLVKNFIDDVDHLILER